MVQRYNKKQSVNRRTRCHQGLSSDLRMVHIYQDMVDILQKSIMENCISTAILEQNLPEGFNFSARTNGI